MGKICSLDCMQVAVLQDHIEVHVKSTKGPIDVYLCEVEKEKPGAKTCEDTDTVTSESETDTSFYPDEGNILLFYIFIHM